MKILNNIYTYKPNNYRQNDYSSRPIINALNKVEYDRFEKSSICKTDKSITFSSINLFDVEKLTTSVSKRTHSKKRIIEKYNEFPEASGVTTGGGIPEEWLNRIKDISKFDKALFLEKLGELFTEDRHYSDIEVLSKGIETLFKDAGIAQKEDKVNTKYVGMGFFGRGFKIDINDEEPKLIKEFKRTYRHHNNHGNYSEQNLAEYINDFSGHDTNMVRYYFGDTKNGIMTVDFISETTSKPSYKVNLDELGLAYDDKKPANYVNDYIIDYGGLITINNLVGNKTAQDIYKTLKHTEDNAKKIQLFNEMISDSNAENYKDKLIGLTHSIRFLPKENQPELYRTMAKFDDTDINVAIIENVKISIPLLD